jgi:hypothetical protein
MLSDLAIVLAGGAQHSAENNLNIFNDNIFLWCNLIDDSYVNNKKLNAIYRFRLKNGDALDIEPINVCYHKVTSRPNKIILKLVDVNNKLIDLKNINIFIDLNLKELS